MCPSSLTSMVLILLAAFSALPTTRRARRFPERNTRKGGLIPHSARRGWTPRRASPEARSGHDGDVEHGRLQGAHQADPQGDVHLHAARGGDVAEVDDVLPPEPVAEETGDHVLRGGVVAGDERGVLATG